MQSWSTDNNYKLLAAAIIKSAVNDYITHGKIAVMNNKDLRTCKELASLRNFFNSQWGEMLMSMVDENLTADGIMSTLNHRLERYAKKRQAKMARLCDQKGCKNEERNNR